MISRRAIEGLGFQWIGIEGSKVRFLVGEQRCGLPESDSKTLQMLRCIRSEFDTADEFISFLTRLMA